MATPRFFQKTLETMAKFDNNPNVTLGLSIFLVLYAALGAPNLPHYVAKVFGNPIFRVLAFFLIAYTANKNPIAAILAAVGMLISMQTLNKQEVAEGMTALVENANVIVDGALDTGGTMVTSVTDTVGSASGRVVETGNDGLDTITGSIDEESSDYMGGEEESIMSSPMEEPLPMVANTPAPGETAAMRGYDLPVPDGVGLGAPVGAPLNECPKDQHQFADRPSDVATQGSLCGVDGYDISDMRFGLH
jgi:hypothetical protein